MSLENSFNRIESKDNDFESIKKLEDLVEKIKTPEEMLSYMSQNIKYGYIGKGNKKVYTPKDSNFDSDFRNEYYLQSPEELIISKRAVCWDQVELERYWFDKNDYDFKTYFIYFAIDDSNLPTHTFLVYKQDNKFYWFEHSWHDRRGIHGYDDIETLLTDVKEKNFESAQKREGATSEDYKYLSLREYSSTKFGANAEEFMSQFS